MSPTEMAYRKTAIGGASGFGLLIALYDTLAGDLRRAAEAERGNDLEKRTNELHHALLVVAYLEDWVSRGSGGALADRLTVFYRTLRRKTIEAQAKRSAQILEQQMDEVLKIRELWQRVEMRGTLALEDERIWQQAPPYAAQASTQYEHSASSWSA
jgi:flagellin-specific chaperone FliS